MEAVLVSGIAYDKDQARVTMRDLPDVERLKLVEKHLISRDLVERAETGAALIRQDRRVSVMIHAAALPRAGSNRAASRQTCNHASCTTSSARAALRTTRTASA